MRIAIDIRNIGKQRTGSEVVVREMVNALLQADQDNTYFLITDSDEKDVLEYINKRLELDRYSNVSVVSLTTKSRAAWIFYHAQHFCKQEQIDIFHTEYIVPFFIPDSTKVITHIHDVSFADGEIRKLLKFKDRIVLDMLIPRSLRRANHIIAVSEFTKNEISRYYGFASDKIHMIYNAPSEIFLESVSQEHKAVVREKYSLPEKFIFSLGTMQPRKNIPFMVDAYLGIAPKLQEVDLVLSGPRAHNFDTKIVKKKADLKNRIHFTGYIDEKDLPAVYACADLFVYPSLYEGFGLPLVESFCAQTPVLCSDIPAHREIASDGAYYVSVDTGEDRQDENIDRCSQALYYLCMQQDIRDDLIHRGSIQQQRYRWENAALQFIELYSL